MLIDIAMLESIQQIGALKGREDYLTSILEMFYTQAGQIIHALEQASANKDQEELIFLAHKLKGMADSIGAVALSEECCFFQILASEVESYVHSKDITQNITSVYRRTREVLIRISIHSPLPSQIMH